MNPLHDPEPLIRRVYAYAAYRLGPGPDAEDVTSDVFERAVRYRESYEPAKGPPIAWLLGITRRAVAGALAARAPAQDRPVPDVEAPGDLAEDATRRLTLAAAVARLPERDRELVALRYGADLTARQIGELLELATNAVEVALHRALARLRAELGEAEAPDVGGVRVRPGAGVLGVQATIDPVPHGKEAA